MTHRHKLPISIASIVAILAVFSASAQAQIAVGELAPNPEPYCVNGPFENIPGPGTSRAAYTVPTAGVLTSWSTNATIGAGQTLTFKVYRPLDPTHYVVVGHDGPRALTPSVVNTFKTAIPVQAGDVIGNNDLANVNVVPNACMFETSNFGDVIDCEEGDFLDGVPFEVFPECEFGSRPNVTATILPPPVVTSISPAGGSIKGGTGVIVGGANFAEVKGVTFGSTPASSFTVNSEGQLTAIAPASAVLAKVNIGVTTLAGTATSTSQFGYEGCTVPKLKGKKLKASKKKARKAGCKIGKVTKRKGSSAKTGKVVKQNPKPGKVLAPGTKIKLTLEG